MKKTQHIFFPDIYDKTNKNAFKNYFCAKWKYAFVSGLGCSPICKKNPKTKHVWWWQILFACQFLSKSYFMPD